MNPVPVSNRWYALTTYSKEEIELTKRLSMFNDEYGVFPYCPMDRYLTVPRHRKSKKPVLVERPLLGGYVFVNMIPSDELWDRVRSTRGCYGVIMNNLLPVQIGGSLIHDMREQEHLVHMEMLAEIRSTDKPILQRVPSPEMVIDEAVQAGTKARIRRGQWKGQVVDVLIVNGKQATVQVTLFGKPCSLNLPLNFLLHIGDAGLAQGRQDLLDVGAKAHALVS